MSKKAKKIRRPIEESANNNLPIRLVRDNDIYRANMQALKEHYPDLAVKIEKTPVNNRFRITRIKPQVALNLYSREGSFYYYNIDDPLKDVIEQIKTLNLKNARLTVFLGMGLGYELMYYAQKEAKKQNTNYILVIEKDPEIFKAAMATVDLTSVITHSQCNFIVGEPEDKLYILLRSYLEGNSRFMLAKAMKPVYHSSALKISKAYYIGAIKSFREAATDQLLYFGNDPYDSLIGVQNMLDNIGEIVANPGINLLYNKFKGRPAVVVSSGPSLNQNKHLLKGLENKALIISADSTLKVLLQMDFKPHMVTALERVPEIVPLLQGIKPEAARDVYLTACPVVYRGVYEAYPGPRIIVYRQFDHFKWLNIDKGMLPIQYSAGNMSFKIAEALGCDPIILIGQDLAFSREGKTHATGMDYGDEQKQYSKSPPIEVMGNDGQPIYTSDIWYKFLRAYEIDVAGYSGTCINCTEGGAYINGTVVMPFHEAIERYIKEDYYPQHVLTQTLSEFCKEEMEQDWKRTLSLVDQTIQDMNEIIENCKTGVQLCEQYREILEPCLELGAVPKQLRRKLTEIQAEVFKPKKQCIQKHNTFQLFFAHVFQSFNIKFEIEIIAIPDHYDNDDLVTVEMILRQVEWYAVIGDLAMICLEALKTSKNELQMRFLN